MAARYFTLTIPTPLNIDPTRTLLRKFDVLYLLTHNLCSEVLNDFIYYEELFAEDMEKTPPGSPPAAGIHRLINFVLNGSSKLPDNCIKAHGDDVLDMQFTIDRVEFGRCSATIVNNQHISVRQNFLFTFLMQDGTVHVFIVDVIFK